MGTLNLNRVCLAGNLTRDPVLRKTTGGTAVVDMGLAVDDPYTAKDGKLVPGTCFADIVVWGKSAEAVHAHLHKGDPALVEGRLHYEQWETDKGERRNRLRVHAARVHFVGGRRDPAGVRTENAGETNDAPPDGPIPF